MKTEYVVEIYNKYHDNFCEKIATFDTYEEAKNYIKNIDIDIDKDSEYIEITEINYESETDDIGIRVGLVAE